MIIVYYYKHISNLCRKDILMRYIKCGCCGKMLDEGYSIPSTDGVRRYCCMDCKNYMESRREKPVEKIISNKPFETIPKRVYVKPEAKPEVDVKEVVEPAQEETLTEKVVVTEEEPAPKKTTTRKKKSTSKITVSE